MEVLDKEIRFLIIEGRTDEIIRKILLGIFLIQDVRRISHEINYKGYSHILDIVSRRVEYLVKDLRQL